MLAESVSHWPIKLNAASDGVFKMLWRNNISFQKNTEKVVLIQVKDFVQIIVKFKAEKHFLHSPIIHIRHRTLNIFLRDTKYRP